jgi:hypothetical protein
MGAMEYFAVHDRGFAHELQDMRRRKGTDEHFQAAVAGRSAGRIHAQIVAADGPAPASFIHYALKLEAGKLLGHVFQAAFDAFGELQAIEGVEALEFFFVYSPIAFGLCPGDTRPLTALNRLLQPLLEFHDNLHLRQNFPEQAPVLNEEYGIIYMTFI